MAFTDSSLTGHSPVWSCCSSTGRSPRRCAISLASIAAHDAAPSVNPNWKAVIRSNAEPCSSATGVVFVLAQQWVAERNHRRQ